MSTQARTNFSESVQLLEQAGWSVKRHEKPRLLPRALHKTFDWVPTDIRNFTEAYEELASPDEKAWLLTEAEYTGRSPSQFAWNEFERQSLAVAGKDAAAVLRVGSFWKTHFPIFQSVKSGYGYCAIAKDGLHIVAGEGPEYEEVTVIAPSFEAFLQMLAKNDEALVNLI